MTSAVHFSSAASEWETPPALFHYWDRIFHFTVDVCATKENAKCEFFYSPEVNGLRMSWGAQRCFLNPPYARGDNGVRPWVQKALHESQENDALVVALLPARTDTRWWHDFVEGKAHVIFLPGRVKFLLDGKEQTSAPFPSAIAIYWPRWR